MSAHPRPPMERFMEKVDKSGDCWLWTAAKNDGYGQFRLDKRTTRRAHRWLYEQLVGTIPDDLQLDHLCRVRNCVNPEHLEPVTAMENQLRGVGTQAALAAEKTHCAQGHPYDERNTAFVKGGYRRCRECNRQITRKWREARRGGPPVGSVRCVQCGQFLPLDKKKHVHYGRKSEAA